MNLFDRVVTGGFAVAAAVALLLGIGTIIYATAVIQPHLERVNDQVVEAVELAERGLGVLDSHSDAIGTLNTPQSNTLATLQELPNALEQSAYLSQHAAEALSRSAVTLREVEDDLGIILPNDALRRNAEALASSSESLRGLSPMLYRLHEETDTVAADLTRATQQAERVQKELQEAEVTIEKAHTHLTEAHRSLQAANLPVEITRLVGMVGGIFIGLSVILMGIAGIWHRLARLSADSSPRRTAPS